MSRNFPNFLKAYVEYASDGFCPPQFHLWTGLSIVAGALERKVWLEQHLDHASIMHYPNIYALLVSHPAVGKTTAMERGMDLLEDMRAMFNPNFKIIPNQITEPALVDAMKIRDEIKIGPSLFAFHSSGFFYASEASASALQNLYGEFTSTLTAFYDCPKWFRKKTKGEKEMTELPNVCFNVLAGSTFNYLKSLVNEESVMGGFASRIIYVICRDRLVRKSKWAPARKLDHTDKREMRDKLIEDLNAIHSLVGKFTPNQEFVDAWEADQPEFDRYLISLDSPRMESLMARKFTNLMKVCMLLSVCESDSLVLTKQHWEKAKTIMDEVTKDNPMILSQAMIADRTSQSGLYQLIGQTLKKNGGEMTMMDLRRAIASNGNRANESKDSIDFLIGSGVIALEGSDRVRLVVDPDTQL